MRLTNQVIGGVIFVTSSQFSQSKISVLPDDFDLISKPPGIHLWPLYFDLISLEFVLFSNKI